MSASKESNSSKTAHVMNLLSRTRANPAAEAAARGSESTANMPAVHGRAAYYGEKSIGLVDGGSVVGRLIFETLAESL